MVTRFERWWIDVARSGIVWDDAALINKLRIAPARAGQALTAAVRYHAPRAERSMKTGAPWTDRTGNARSSLFTTPEISPGHSYGFVLGHGVSYGIWLEVRWSGRYATVGPTIQREGPEFMKTCSQLFSRMWS
jgi:hypothetical protein